MIFLEYLVVALTVVAVVWWLLSLFLPPRMSRFNISVLSFAFLSAVTGVFLGVPLLVGDLLYTEALNFAEFEDFLVFLALAAALSTLVLEAEGPAVRVLSRSTGLDKRWCEVGFTFVHGLATAPLLALSARLVPGVELMNIAALAVSLVGVFGFYFAEQIFVHSGSSDADAEALMNSPREDEED